jgi:hypothetical protein
VPLLASTCVLVLRWDFLFTVPCSPPVLAYLQLTYCVLEFVFQYASLGNFILQTIPIPSQGQFFADWLQAQEIAPRADPPPSPPQPPVPKNSVKRERSPSLDLDQSDVKFLDPDDVAHITRIKVRCFCLGRPST